MLSKVFTIEILIPFIRYVLKDKKNKKTKILNFIYRRYQIVVCVDSSILRKLNNKTTVKLTVSL